MSTQNSFKKGAIEMLLLQILNQKGDCYGYQLSQLIHTLSNGYLVVPEGSMYPALYKLIEKGHISDYKKQVGKRLIRVYYHIEENGKERLTNLIEEYYATNRSIEKILKHDFTADEAETEES